MKTLLLSRLSIFLEGLCKEEYLFGKRVGHGFDIYHKGKIYSIQVKERKDDGSRVRRCALNGCIHKATATSMYCKHHNLKR